MTVLLDSILYNASIEVTQVDKQRNIVTVIDLFNNRKERTVKLHQSKKNCYHYYFRMNKRSYWLHCLFEIDKRND